MSHHPRRKPTDLQASLRPLHELLGFREDYHLRDLHAGVVAAIVAGRSGPRRQAWLRYVEAADPQVDFPDDGLRNNRARAGLAIAQALINIEAGEVVGFLTQLLLAEAAAAAGGWVDIKVVLDIELAEFTDTARYIQAQANYAAQCANFDTSRMLYDLAISRYIEIEAISDPGDPAVRGLLNLRVAECYGEILQLEGEGLVQLVAGDTEQFQQLMFDSLQLALRYLVPSQREYAKAMGMIEGLEKKEWWQHLANH